MDINEAVQASIIISPKIAVPIHDMCKNDPWLFKEKLEKQTNIEVVVLGIGEVIEL
jgi:hypothetical protein